MTCTSADSCAAVSLAITKASVFRIPMGNGSDFTPISAAPLQRRFFGDGQAVEFVPLTDKERFDALSSGAVDLLSRHTAWTMSRDTDLKLTFPVATFFDGQSFLVRGEMGLTSAKELSGTPICVEAGSQAELDAARFFDVNSMAYNPVVFDRGEGAVAAYETARCGAYTDNISGLYALRLGLAEPELHTVLPDIISRTAVGPVIRADDERWFKLLRWVHFALVKAEELGISSDMIADLTDSRDQDIRVFLGLDPSDSQPLGLDGSWMANIVDVTGNYAEIFERNLGSGSDLGMSRGLNRLWRDGGLQHAPPVR